MEKCIHANKTSTGKIYLTFTLKFVMMLLKLFLAILIIFFTIQFLFLEIELHLNTEIIFQDSLVFKHRVCFNINTHYDCKKLFLF